MRLLNQNSKIKENNLVYWHKHTISESEIKTALAKNITIEVDLSFDEVKNMPYIGHSPEIYNRFLDKYIVGDNSKNISFEQLANYVNNYGLKVVMDCKSAKILEFLNKNPKYINLNGIVFHAFVKEWCFDPDNRRVKESIRIADITKFKVAHNNDWIGTSIVKDYNQIDSEITNKIFKTGKNIISGISFFTKLYQLPFPNLKVFKLVSGNGFVPVFASDLLLFKPDFQYVGLSNLAINCTNVA